MKILIIGAVAAGLKSASKARREDGKAEITVLERREDHFLWSLWNALLCGRRSS